MTAVVSAPIYWRVFGRGDHVSVIAANTEDEYAAAVKRLRWRPMGRERAKVHECAACRSVGPWSDGWAWWGSYNDIDDGKEVVKTCSEACRIKAKQLGLIPRNARMEVENDL
jgi:hypothetical protein